MISEEEWAEINREMLEGSGKEPIPPKHPLENGRTLSPKETGKKIKEHEQILIEMRKEISALGFTIAQHQSYFELLQKLVEQQKIEVVKN
jgi:hypothetical protein